MGESYAKVHAHGIGCGELSATLGLDWRTSAVDLWAIKRGLVEPKDSGDASTERGNALERAVVDWAEERIGLKLDRQGEHFDVPLGRGHLLGSPDALRFGPRNEYEFGLEAKTRQYMTGWGPEEDGEAALPIDVATQVHGYLALTGAPRWYVAVLFGMPFEFRLYAVDRDEARCARILAHVESWWQRHVVEGAPLEPKPEERSTLARLLNGQANGDVLRSSAPEVVAAMLARRDAELAREAAQAALSVAEAEWRATGGVIEELLGAAERLETPVGSASLKSRSSRGRLVTRWNQGETE